MTTRTLQQERLIGIVRRFSRRQILVVGDAMADQFVFGAISRVSREAPVFILRHEHTETVPGGAANCALNLAALGASVSLISIVGSDEAGQGLVEKLKSGGVDCSATIVSDDFQTTTKVRILAGQVHSTRQQVIRIDYEGDSAKSFQSSERLHELLHSKAGNADAIIISDYNYGVVEEETATILREVKRDQGVPVLVDSRFKLSNFAGFTSATPNQDEVEQLLETTLTGAEALATIGEQMRARLGYRALLITRGGEGMMLLEEGAKPLCLAAVGAREPVDPTGAGDTVIATYTLALASDASFPDAARLANYAGGLVVMKRGTASITSAELEHSILHDDLS